MPKTEKSERNVLEKIKKFMFVLVNEEMMSTGSAPCSVCHINAVPSDDPLPSSLGGLSLFSGAIDHRSHHRCLSSAKGRNMGCTSQRQGTCYT